MCVCLAGVAIAKFDVLRSASDLNEFFAMASIAWQVRVSGWE